MEASQRRRQAGWICLGLAVAVFCAFGQLWKADFINFDDNDYVTSNDHVKAGLTVKGFQWAWTTGYQANWHPLTWLSHMLDVQLYGLNAGGHHLTNILLHAANSILLFLLLRRMTKEHWPSAVVAALFALHPLHVESVAWVAERKDVLSTLFWILSIWAYARWVENPGGIPAPVLSITLFAAGLLAKPMLVTLPFVLLLLDYWPLQRRDVPWKKLIDEKLPFFFLSAASCLITYSVQRAGGAVLSLETWPWSVRLANVPVSYMRYILKLLWPEHLAVPILGMIWPGWMVGAAMVLLLAVTAWVLLRLRSKPWLAVGWFWFLGTLVPVIGLLQVGMQSMADRYSYIPSVGFFIMVVWAARPWSVRLAPVVLAACFVLTVHQVSFWKNTGTLFRHSLQVSPDNFVAWERLEPDELAQGRIPEAIAYLKKAEALNPKFMPPKEELGKIYLEQGRIDDAIAELRSVVAHDPKFAAARYDLGYALLEKGQLGDALDQFQQQVNLEPHLYKAQLNMGSVLLQSGLAGDAIPFLQKAAELEPALPEPHHWLGQAFYRTGRTRDAIGQYEKAIALDPHDAQSMNDLAWILACNADPAIRNGRKAVELAAAAVSQMNGQSPVIIGTLAAAQAEAGDFGSAVTNSERAIFFAQAQTNQALAEVLSKRLRAYQANTPWRDVK